MKRFHPHFRGYKIGFNEGKVNSYLPSINSDLYVADIGIPIEIYKSKINIDWNPPFLLESLEQLKFAFSQESILNVKIKRSLDLSNVYWEIN